MWKTQKPEFGSNFITVTYNDDDTRATVTDPRGSQSIVSYNGRHLVTGISYTPSSGVTDTPTVSYTYDAVGNRLSMTSDVSTVEYDYDTASRLESETQSIAGLTGEFTINYTYKPSGSLASIEDPYDRVVSYSYDRTGSIASVSATNYPNVSSFISGVQYRAWGAPKSIAYGNGVDENSEFNERMQPTEFELADLRIWDNSTYTDRVTFDYYDDGRLFHSFYATGITKFDRKFEYDFAGRIKEAYTGREAHDQSPLTPRDNPFRQSLQYDAFGNMTQRSGMLWRQTLPTDTATYTNNMRDDWSYDSGGNVSYTDAGASAYDAAGRKFWGTPQHTDDLGNGNYRMFMAYISQSMDGDGLIRSRWESRYVEESIGEDFEYNEEETTTFNLWSSALGSIVAELDENGDQITGFVYAGTQIARLDITPSSSVVKFRFSNTVGGTLYEADHTGLGGRRSEFDPLGAEVPKTDPYILNKRLYTDLKPKGLLFINGGDPFHYDMSCVLDGQQADCAMVRRMMESGALAQRGADGVVRDIVNLGPGWYGVLGDRYWVDSPDKKKLDPTLETRPGTEFEEGDVIVENTDADDLDGYWVQEYEILPQGLVPQTPTLGGNPTDLQNAIFQKAYKDMINRLKNSKCANLFGGKEAVEKALKETNFAVADLGEPKENPDGGFMLTGRVNAEADSNPVKLNIHGNMFVQNGKLIGAGGKQYTIPIYNRNGSLASDLGLVSFQSDVGVGAFLLLHELGHLVGKFGPDFFPGDEDKTMKAQKEHNDKVLNACFSLTRNKQRNAEVTAK